MEPAIAARPSTLSVGRDGPGEDGQNQGRRHRSRVNSDLKTREYCNQLLCVRYGPRRPQKLRAKPWQNGKANNREGKRGWEEEDQNR